MRIVKVKGSKGGNQVIVMYTKCLFSGTRSQCEKYIKSQEVGKQYDRRFDTTMKGN